MVNKFIFTIHYELMFILQMYFKIHAVSSVFLIFFHFPEYY